VFGAPCLRTERSSAEDAPETSHRGEYFCVELHPGAEPWQASREAGWSEAGVALATRPGSTDALSLPSARWVPNSHAANYSQDFPITTAPVMKPIEPPSPRWPDGGRMGAFLAITNRFCGGQGGASEKKVRKVEDIRRRNRCQLMQERVIRSTKLSNSNELWLGEGDSFRVC